MTAPRKRTGMACCERTENLLKKLKRAKQTIWICEIGQSFSLFQGLVSLNTGISCFEPRVSVCSSGCSVVYSSGRISRTSPSVRSFFRALWRHVRSERWYLSAVPRAAASLHTSWNANVSSWWANGPGDNADQPPPERLIHNSPHLWWQPLCSCTPGLLTTPQPQTFTTPLV